jgi:hypothetical protein
MLLSTFRYFRSVCRLVSLFANGVSLLIFHHLQPIAAKAYDDLCASQGVNFGGGESAEVLWITMGIVAVPILLARSNVLVVANLILSSISLFGSSGLFATAGNTPYECFTTGGTYEDHTSGLDGFAYWYAFVLVLSYLLLFIDLSIWVARKIDWSRLAKLRP